MKTLPAGIHRDVPFSDYLADPCERPSLSASIAWALISESPLHAWHQHPRLGGSGSDNSNVANKGTAAHDLLLGGEGKLAILEFENFRSRAAQDQRDEAIAAGKTPVLVADMEAVIEQVEAARAFIAESEHPEAMSAGYGEATGVWEEDGILCRIRPDWFNPDAPNPFIHYKTSAGSVRPGDFERRSWREKGYAFTMRFYARGARALGLSDDSLVLAQEQHAPYACAWYGLDPANKAFEDMRVERAVSLWRECVLSGRWPGYGGRVHYVEPSAWELADEEARMASTNENGKG